MQPGRGDDAADYFCERDMQYGRDELKDLAVGKPQTEKVAAADPPTTFGDFMETHSNVPGRSQVLQLTSRPGCSQMRLGSRKPQSHKRKASLLPQAVNVLSLIKKLKPVEPVSIDPCIYCP